ncbi:MAG: hypothetical protein EZS28_047369, partial [Streblomastix strix]
MAGPQIGVSYTRCTR